jgi:hypothetical protein
MHLSPEIREFELIAQDRLRGADPLCHGILPPSAEAKGGSLADPLLCLSALCPLVIMNNSHHRFSACCEMRYQPDTLMMSSSRLRTDQCTPERLQPEVRTEP